jgi:hypothetical protein
MACERHLDGRVLELAAANLDRRKIRSIGDEQRKTAGEEGKEEQEEEEEEGKRERAGEGIRRYILCSQDIQDKRPAAVPRTL